jgi:hypothetical protein
MNEKRTGTLGSDRDDDDTTETAAFVCGHVFDRTKRVLLAVHDDDGDWQFLCGDDHDADDPPRVIGLNHVPESDPTVREVMDLPRGWVAERHAVGAAWNRSRLE